MVLGTAYLFIQVNRFDTLKIFEVLKVVCICTKVGTSSTFNSEMHCILQVISEITRHFKHFPQPCQYIQFEKLALNLGLINLFQIVYRICLGRCDSLQGLFKCAERILQTRSVHSVTLKTS